MFFHLFLINYVICFTECTCVNSGRSQPCLMITPPWQRELSLDTTVSLQHLPVWIDLSNSLELFDHSLQCFHYTIISVFFLFSSYVYELLQNMCIVMMVHFLDYVAIFFTFIKTFSKSVSCVHCKITISNSLFCVFFSYNFYSIGYICMKRNACMYNNSVFIYI